MWPEVTNLRKFAGFRSAPNIWYVKKINKKSERREREREREGSWIQSDFWSRPKHEKTDILRVNVPACSRLPEHPTRRTETERRESSTSSLSRLLSFQVWHFQRASGGDSRSEAAMELRKSNGPVLVGVYLWATFYYQGGLPSPIQATFVKMLMFPCCFAWEAMSLRGESCCRSYQMWPHLAWDLYPRGILWGFTVDGFVIVFQSESNCFCIVFFFFFFVALHLI